MDFQGTHEHTLDAKNRLTIPAEYRHRFEDGLVLVQGIEPCIEIWIPKDYEAFVEGMLAGRSRLAPETRKLARFFGGRSNRTSLDSANRVLLTSGLIEHASIDRDVTVQSAADCLEVWDRERCAAMNAELTAEFADLTALLGRQG